MNPCGNVLKAINYSLLVDCQLGPRIVSVSSTTTHSSIRVCRG
jgi:hypothetical protein